MSQNEDVIEINLWKLILVCLQRWWLILLVALICGTAGFVYSRFFIEPTYESTVKIYVNNSQIDVGNISISSSDLTASAKLVDIYEVILKTKDTLDVIIEKADLTDTYTYKDVRKMLSTASVNETQIFEVKVTNTDPKRAHLIASTIANELPSIIADIIDSADARIVEHSIVAEEKVGPSNTRNAMLGAIIGFVLVVGVLVVMELLDTTIKDEDDLREVIDTIPVLAYIPDLNGNKKKLSRYARNYYRSNYYKAYTHEDREGGDN